MEIAAYQPESFIDYPGKISTVIFTAHCNYKCPWCHAKNVLAASDRVSEKEFFDYLVSKKDWLDAVVICGGEPTLEQDLEEFAEKIKQKGFLVKLDTNGSNPDILKDLLDKKLIDYVAMDVKATKGLYPNVSGTGRRDLAPLIEKSMKIVARFPDYEFRTTIAPVKRKENIMSLSPEEVEEIAKWIVKATGKNTHKYYLQRFVPRKGGLLNEEMENCSETPEDLLKQIHDKVLKHLPNTKTR